MTPLNLSVQNDTLYAVAALAIIILCVVLIFAFIFRGWRP
jgi:hypothetical protein